MSICQLQCGQTMTDPVLDDPGELVRFWLWHQQRHTVRSFKIANLATALKAKPAAVGAWLSRHAIPSQYWNPIARHFERGTYRRIEDEAAVLWADPKNRKGYTPLHDLQIKRRIHAGLPSARTLEHPETPALLGEYLRQSDAATPRRQRQPPVRLGPARKSLGKRRGA